MAQPLKLVVGLGNPGRRYASTRHNVGFRVVEAFARRHGVRVRRSWRMPCRFGRGEAFGTALAVVEPLTFMNRSGEAVEAVAQRFGVDPVDAALAVVYDDLDLPFGRIRVRAGGGAGGHRGVEDIIDVLDSRDFARLRFGIGRPQDGAGITDWVLAPFDPEEESALPDHIETAVDALDLLLREGATAAMNRFNAG